MKARRLDAASLPAILALREAVLARLPHPDSYVPHAEEQAFVRAHLGEAGLSCGVERDGALVAYGMLSLRPARARLDPELLARLGDGQVAVLAAAMVHPAHQGRGLHRALIDFRLEAARAAGCPRLAAMVSPHAPGSLRTLLARGLAIRGLVDFPDGRVRYFLEQELPLPSVPAGGSWHPLTAREAHRELFRAGRRAVELTEGALRFV